MDNVTPLWRWPDLERLWNDRQMKGQPCEDLTAEMLREISPERRDDRTELAALVSPRRASL